RLGPGTPLPDASRARFERRLGRDLSAVRLHQGPEAASATRGVGARAFALGRDIALGADAPPLSTAAGERLLAHEVAHTLQDDTGVLRRENGDGGSMDAGTTDATTMPAPEECGPLADPAATSTEGARVPRPRLPVLALPVRELTNAELIAEQMEVAGELARAFESSPETEAWQLRARELRTERQRRIGLGFVFLADPTEGTPASLYTMRRGAVGVMEIVVADGERAMGTPDVTLTGAIMTLRQVNGYIDTLGYQRVNTARAQALLANPAQLIALAGAGPEAGYRPMMPLAPGVGRTSFLDWRLGGTGEGRMPILLSDANFRGRLGEIGTASDWRSGWGTGLEDFNRRPWIDITGRSQTGNFPLLDFGPAADSGVPRILGVRRISVTTSGAADYATRRQQYIMKIEALLDVAGRRATTPAGTDPVLAHLRAASGNAALAPGTPDFAAAEARFLPDTLFAVPDAELAALRSAIADPNARPGSGGHRLIARSGGFRALYAEALRGSPITVTLRDGSRVTISTMAELAARAPSSASFTVEGAPPTSYATNQRMTPTEFGHALGELGRTASSRIIGASSAPAMAAAADAHRGAAATPTRILEIDSSNQSYIAERIGAGLADPRGTGTPGSGTLRWTTAAETDPVLSALRNLTGDMSLTRGTPEFEAARRQMLGDALLAINADDVAAFRGTLTGDEAWSGRLRESFGAAMADSPVTVTLADGSTRTFSSPADLDAARNSLSPAEYAAARSQAQGLVADRVMGHALTTEHLTGLEGFRNRAVTSLGADADSVMRPEAIEHARFGHRGAMGRNFGRGGLGGFVIGVATTGGMMYIDEREHPDWAVELASAGTRDAVLSGTQMALEGRTISYLAERSIARGTPLSAASRFGVRAGFGGTFALGMEGYRITQEQREHSAVEVGSRLARAAGIAILATEIGAAAGSIVPGAGTAAGAVVGFLVGAAAGVVTAYVLEEVVPGSAEDWAEATAPRGSAAAAPPRPAPPTVVASFGDSTSLLPVMSSPDISTEEQEAIAQWVALLSMASREPPSDAAP
uniref:eCIS core domain-containing protein n=1 Tax=Falsiroseomonas oryzae TaxID=2766473 RepID=UPI0022EB6069